jgi:hypothetical protein
VRLRCDSNLSSDLCYVLCVAWDVMRIVKANAKGIVFVRTFDSVVASSYLSVASSPL